MRIPPMDKCLAMLMSIIMICCSTVYGTVDLKKIDWPVFLSKHDIIWEQLPQKFDHGAFVGNGMLGMTVFQEGDHSIRLAMGRSDVTDHRFDNGRVMMGGMIMKTAGRITEGSLRTSLWNAEVIGEIVTDRGTVLMTAYTHAGKMVSVVDIKTTGEEAVSFSWDHAKSFVATNRGEKVNTPPNPSPVSGVNNGIHFCRQQRVAGGSYTIAWQEQSSKDNKRLYVTIMDSYPEDRSTDSALAQIKQVAQIPLLELSVSHRNWWHAYYPASFLSVPDSQIEGFYWIQMYKYGSAIRQDSVVLDLQGPWNRKTAWPRVWWNLNIQIAYYGLFAANRLELGESFTRFIDAKRMNFVKNAKDIWDADNSATVSHTTCYEGLMGDGVNAPPHYINPADFTWALHLYWLQYRYSMDDKLITDQRKYAFYPLLKQSVNLYRKLLIRGEDGMLHLPVLHSPEYIKEGDSDNNYNLSALRWACQTLLYLNKRYGLNDPVAAEWQGILDELIPYPQNENGFMIGANVAFEHSHRHWSHMLMIWPFHLLTVDQPENRKVVEKSLLHWLTVDNGRQIFGWSNAAASLLYSTMGNGGEAVKQLRAHHNYRSVMPNTMYIEGSPVMECSLFACKALQEMLLQSVNGRIKIFPAVPEDWQEACFGNMRAEGAFLLSARREKGKTRWVKITSLGGESCVIEPNLGDKFLTSLPGERVTRLDQKTVELDLKKGESVLLYQSKSDFDAIMKPCDISPKEHNYWGVKKNPLSREKTEKST